MVCLCELPNGLIPQARIAGWAHCYYNKATESTTALPPTPTLRPRRPLPSSSTSVVAGDPQLSPTYSTCSVRLYSLFTLLFPHQVDCAKYYEDQFLYKNAEKKNINTFIWTFIVLKTLVESSFYIYCSIHRLKCCPNISLRHLPLPLDIQLVKHRRH